MRAKFVSTTNRGLDAYIPKEQDGNLDIQQIIVWSHFTSPKCFHSSLVKSYVYNEESGLLNVETSNSEYVFRLDKKPDTGEIVCALFYEANAITEAHTHIKHSLFTLRMGLFSGGTRDEIIQVNPPLSYYEARDRFVGNIVKDDDNTTIGEVRYVVLVSYTALVKIIILDSASGGLAYVLQVNSYEILQRIMLCSPKNPQELELFYETLDICKDEGLMEIILESLSPKERKEIDEIQCEYVLDLRNIGEAISEEIASYLTRLLRGL